VDYYTKFQCVALCEAMIRCVNDNIFSISLAIEDNGDILVRVILLEKTTIEEELMKIMHGEFSAYQDCDCVLPFEELIGLTHQPLKHLVYQVQQHLNNDIHYQPNVFL
jgi:hypothetical protein